MKRMNLEKAYEITDAKIQFVSLVDKAANKRTFLITKQADGKAAFASTGRILKADAENHYITGVVYEPMIEDTHGNYMTEDEITKAAYWFAENGNEIDLQHNFEPLEKAKVVETWIAKADFDIDGEKVSKGTWLMTVKIANDAIWDAVQKGEITGFSMGGVGTYSEEDTDLSSIEKSKESSEKKSLLKQIAKALGFNIEKGEFAEAYKNRTKADQFWSAFSTLQDILRPWNGMTGESSYITDEEKIREVLSEFNDTITALLTDTEPIAKALNAARPVEKAGRSISGKNKETLQGIYESLGTFLAAFDDPEKEKKPVVSDPEDGEEDDPKPEENPAGEDTPPEDGDGEPDKNNKKDVKKEGKEMTEQQVKDIMQTAITKAIASMDGEQTVQKEATPEVTESSIQKMVDEAIQKAMQPQEEQLTADQVQSMVTKAVGEAIAPLMKSRGLPYNIDGETEVKKNAEQHYLHGII